MDEELGCRELSWLGDLPSSADPREVWLWEEVHVGHRTWEKSRCSLLDPVEISGEVSHPRDTPILCWGRK